MKCHIKRLDEDVVNRIAAGEVIQRPSSVIKELIENSIDAKSTLISIHIRGGGLEWMQIQDNGTGINKEDLSIVCERFTTSKLFEFDDLKTISTYGFRGEALASVSHVSVLTILTKTKCSPCAYKSKYCHGVPVPFVFGGSVDPLKCAGVDGTIITIEDLFHNVQIRKQSFKNSNEEYQRILDVVTKYSIHCGDLKIGFICKKNGSASLDISSDSTNSTLGNIRKIYGETIHCELLPVNAKFPFLLKGYITNSGFTCKKATVILFVNNRLVECRSIRQAIESAYNESSISGRVFPFVYLALSLPPENVDVNVHPTKSEVHFLFEEELVKYVHDVVVDTLKRVINSKKFSISSIHSESVDCDVLEPLMLKKDELLIKTMDYQIVDQNGSVVVCVDKFYSEMDFIEIAKKSSKSTPLTTFKVVRSVANQQKLKSYFNLHSNNVKIEKNVKIADVKPLNLRCVCGVNEKFPVANTNCGEQLIKNDELKRRYRSSQTLIRAIEQASDVNFCILMKNCVYIGSVDEVFSLVQNDNNLWLVDNLLLMESLFCQVLIMSGGKLPFVCVKVCVKIFTLIVAAIETFGFEDSEFLVGDIERQNIGFCLADVLIKHRGFLKDYFALCISIDGELQSIPIVLNCIIPSNDKIPLLLLSIATNVHWDDHTECLRSVAEILSRFYSSCVSNLARECVGLNVMEDLIFPAVKSGYLPPLSSFDGEVMFFHVASLNQMYKVFERC